MNRLNIFTIIFLLILISLCQLVASYICKEYLFLNIIISFTLVLFSLLNIKKELLRLKEFLTTYLMSLLFFYCLFRIVLSRDFYFFQFYIYMMSLCIYHFIEYMFVCVFHFESLNFNSFLINQSKEYIFATTFSILEYFVEILIFGTHKINIYLIITGFIMLIIGHIFRISALFTAGSNFTHLIAYKKKQKHQLVKRGIYSISRHPSYFGFFIWSIGCQVLCFNPVCIIGFTYVLWKFFSERIKDEEPILITFFGEEYLEYKAKVPILIPCKIKLNLKF